MSKFSCASWESISSFFSQKIIWKLSHWLIKGSLFLAFFFSSIFFAFSRSFSLIFVSNIFFLGMVRLTILLAHILIRACFTRANLIVYFIIYGWKISSFVYLTSFTSSNWSAVFLIDASRSPTRQLPPELNQGITGKSRVKIPVCLSKLMLFR